MGKFFPHTFFKQIMIDWRHLFHQQVVDESTSTTPSSVTSATKRKFGFRQLPDASESTDGDSSINDHPASMTSRSGHGCGSWWASEAVSPPRYE